MDGCHDNPNRTILWSLPATPVGFINVTSNPPQPGRYVFGQNIFHSKEMPLTSILDRKLGGSAEDVLLGTISVLLIATLSEMVFSILLRTSRNRNDQKIRKGLQVAFLLDELYHFRNVARHCHCKLSCIHKSESHLEPQKTRSVGILKSLLVLTVTLVLLAADVFAVYLTQPKEIRSKDFAYNLRGVQPISTERNLARYVRRNTLERTCMTPIFTSTGQKREFTISACIRYDITEAHNYPRDYLEEVTVSSYYHKAGSDHFVLWGNASVAMQSRTYIYINGNGTRRVLYETRDTESFDYGKYIHELFIYSCMEYSCNRRGSDKTCDEIIEEKKTIYQKLTSKEIELWRPRGRQVHSENVTGLETRYRVRLYNPFRTITSQLSPLTTTSMLEEVRGPGWYINSTTEEFENDIDGLIVEEGRVAGLVALTIIFSVCFTLLIILRLTLRPLSLGAIAWESQSERPFEIPAVHLKRVSEEPGEALSLDVHRVPPQGGTGHAVNKGDELVPGNETILQTSKGNDVTFQ